MKCIIKRARYNNFYKVLVYISTIDKPRRFMLVVDSTELLRNICKAMLVYNNLQTYIVVLDQENINIDSKKTPY